jgi:hypothetical protein
MIKNSFFSLISLCCLCILIACSGSQIKTNANVSDIKDAMPLLDMVNKINDNSPETFSASFETEGSMGTNKFKLVGTAFYDKKLEKFTMNFSDYIFKSQLSSLLRNGKNIEVYYIPESKIILDSSETIKIKNYVPIDMDFNLIYQLLTSRIPLIENYSIHQAKKDDDKSFLVLQNNNWYETIAFNLDEPERIKLTNKKTSQEIEIYLRSPLKQNESRYYKKIQIIIKDVNITRFFHNTDAEAFLSLLLE